MDGRERMLRTLEFRNPDRIPLQIGYVPVAMEHYNGAITREEILKNNDMHTMTGPLDGGYDEDKLGFIVDPWGSTWKSLEVGRLGEVKKPAVEDYDDIDSYRAPVPLFLERWEQERDRLQAELQQLHADGKFVTGGWITVFERLQYVRGTEDVLCDLVLEEEGLFKLLDIVMDFYRVYLEKWLELDVDGIAFGDDWGTQRNLLVNPALWRKYFKPLYKELFGNVKAAGKKVFFHTDGYVYELYGDLIELGVDAINSQVWMMDIEQIARNYAGKVTFWGEISRQTTMPFGTPEDVQAAIDKMKALFFVNGGGLIGNSHLDKDVPIANALTLMHGWNRDKE